jgi:endonuclease/exonuclease/phosphatase family metal-dependent hydrolase
MHGKMERDVPNGIFVSVTFLFLFFTALFLNISAEEEKSREHINVMSFNIRYDNPEDGDNSWPNRKEMVAENIRFHKIDIAGLQEVLHNQVKDLEALLPEYDWFGVGRDDGQKKGEYTPIFYLRARFEVLNQSTFWLSETPENPGKGWDAACLRIATWGKIEDRLTKAVFFLFNTHLDHVGETARVEGARLLLKNIDALTDDGPVILTGDFNCTEEDLPYKILTSGIDQYSGLSDSYSISKFKPYGSTQTYNGFRDEILTKSRIDFIFVQNINKIIRHGTIAEKWDGRFVSDHNAVMAEVRIADGVEK